jgi:hypothetical protein
MARRRGKEKARFYVGLGMLQVLPNVQMVEAGGTVGSICSYE